MLGITPLAAWLGGAVPARRGAIPRLSLKPPNTETIHCPHPAIVAGQGIAAKPDADGVTRTTARRLLFTGFAVAPRAQLEAAALRAGLRVVKSVTHHLAYLVTGPNAGPAKVAACRAARVAVLDKTEFLAMLETGELPTGVAENLATNRTKRSR